MEKFLIFQVKNKLIYKNFGTCKELSVCPFGKYISNIAQWNYVGDYDVRINDRQCNNNCYIPSFRGSNALIHCRTSDTSNVKVSQCAPGYYMDNIEEIRAPNPTSPFNNNVETHTFGTCQSCIYVLN